jgi:hypothetical protein
MRILSGYFRLFELTRISYVLFVPMNVRNMIWIIVKNVQRYIISVFRDLSRDESRIKNLQVSLILSNCLDLSPLQ